MKKVNVKPLFQSAISLFFLGACILLMGCQPKQPVLPPPPHSIADLRNVMEAPPSLRNAAQAIVLVELQSSGEKGVGVFVGNKGDFLASWDSLGPNHCLRKGCNVTLHFEKQFKGQSFSKTLFLKPKSSHRFGAALFEVRSQDGATVYSPIHYVAYSNNSNPPKEVFAIGHPEIPILPTTSDSLIPRFGLKKFMKLTPHPMRAGFWEVTGHLPPGVLAFFTFNPQGELVGILSGKREQIEDSKFKSKAIPLYRISEMFEQEIGLGSFKLVEAESPATLKKLCDDAIQKLKDKNTSEDPEQVLKSCIAATFLKLNSEEQKTWREDFINTALLLLDAGSQFPYQTLVNKDVANEFYRRITYSDLQLEFWLLKVEHPRWREIAKRFISLPTQDPEEYHWILLGLRKLYRLSEEKERLSKESFNKILEKASQDKKLGYYQRLVLERIAFEEGIR